MKILFRNLILLNVLLIAGCGKEKTCTQKAEVRRTLQNETNLDQTLEFEVMSLGIRQEVKEHVVAANSSLSALFHSYTYEERPYHQGKLDLSPDPAKCTDTPKPGSGLIQLHDTNADVKLCFANTNYKVHIVDIAAPCPDETFERERW